MKISLDTRERMTPMFFKFWSQYIDKNIINLSSGIKVKKKK